MRTKSRFGGYYMLASLRSDHVRNEGKGIPYAVQFQKIRDEEKAEAGWVVGVDRPRPIDFYYPNRRLYDAR